ncbi:ATP-binding protein [Synechococcus sp. CCAP 1479/10]|uniref:ATP-binding protein n=1 Tax=Synechococcus sp. CCAP 1479/10 TaxID=1221594 RepID=UPI001C249DBD
MLSSFSKWRYFRPVVIVGAVALVVGGAGSAWLLGEGFVRVQEDLQTGAGFERAESTARVAEQLLLRNLDDMATLRLLAQQWVLMDDVADAVLRRQMETTLRHLVRDRGERRTPFRSVVILGPDGRMQWSSIPDSMRFEASDRDYFIALRDGFRGTFVTAPIAGRGTGGTIILAAQRLQDAAGDFGGVMLVGLRPEELRHALAPLAEREGDVVAVIRRQGDALVRALRGPQAGGVPIAGPVPAGGNPWTRELDENGEYTARGRNPFTQAETLRAGRLVADTNLAVFVAVDAKSELRGIPALRNSVRMSVLGGLLAGLLAVAGGVAISRARRLKVEASALRQGRGQVERLHGGLPVVLFLRESLGPRGPSRLLYRGGDIDLVTGWPDGRLGGTADWTPYLAKGTPWIDDCIADALAHGSIEYDWQLRQPDGSARRMSTVLVRVSVHPNGGGEVVGYTRDVSAQYEASRRAEQARIELDQTLAAAPVVVFRGSAQPDGSFRKTFVSTGMERLTGWPMETINQPGGLRSILGNPERLAADVVALLAEGKVSGDYTMRCRDGRLITVAVTMTVMRRAADGRTEVVGYIADVTAEREAKARAITSARLASLGEMSAGLAHELKQPLQAITLAATNTQSAVERGDTAAASQRLQRIIGYAKRAAEVIEHLRRFARGPEVGGEPQPVPVKAAIEGAQSLVASSLRDAMVQLVVTLGDPPPVVLGHLVALEQVLSNLIMNARDAVVQTAAEERPRRIEVSAVADASAGLVSITIADTGGGLPDAVLARLFQPFVSTKGPDLGTGLGLSICHGLVTGMGGTISAANEGPGAVFRISLPAAPAQASLPAAPALT